MPCTDYSIPNPTPSPNQVSFSDLQAMLCAVLTVIESGVTVSSKNRLDGVLGAIDWKQAGVTRSKFDKWWKAHKKADAERRKAALEKRLLDVKRVAALAKLTAEERKALGI